MISEIDIADWDRSKPLQENMMSRRSHFKQDIIALLNAIQPIDDRTLMDAIIYNCVMYKEDMQRDDSDLLDEIGNAGLTD